MAKDDRSALNPFTGREHHDNVNDDQFLAECYDEYYKMLNYYKALADDAYKRGKEAYEK